MGYAIGLHPLQDIGHLLNERGKIDMTVRINEHTGLGPRNRFKLAGGSDTLQDRMGKQFAI